MDFSLTEEQLLLQRTVREFARQELLPRYRAWDRSGAFPADLWRQMGTMGLTGARVPEDWGGQSLSAVTTGIAVEEVARGDFNLSYAVFMPALVGEVLARFAGERVKRDWLAPMARGEAIIGLALTEPGAGSDAKMITCRAVRDGDEYVVSGEKSGISLAQAADAMVLSPRPT
ncbi:MAG: acyl-CoA dehydrogenase family protein [Dehalococcoidia bacterium]